MPPITVTASTNVVLIDTAANPNAVVILPSLNPGQTVTIRDSVGFLSTPNKITISTAAGISFLDGTSTVQIYDRFGYVTVRCRNAFSWILTNSYGFPQNRSIASVSSITASTITAASISATSSINTLYVNATNGRFSTLDCAGQGAFSTLVIGSPNIPLPGIDLTVNGSMNVAGHTRIGGNLVVTSSMTIGSVSTGAVTGTSLALQDNLIVGGNIIAPNAIMTANLITASTATIQNIVATSITGTSLVTSTLSSQNITTNSLNVLNQIQLQGLTITPVENTMVFSAGLNIPSLTTGNMRVANGIATSNLQVDNSINAPNMEYMQLNSTQINNQQGSLTISTLGANKIESLSLTTGNVQTMSLFASSINLAGNFVQPAVGYMTINTAIINSLSTQNFYGGTIKANTFAVSSISVNSLDVGGNFSGSTLSSLYIPNAAVTSASLATSSITSAALTTSSLTLRSGLVETASTITMTASTATMNNVSTGVFRTNTLNASSITASHITIGSPVVSTLRGPYLVCTSSTNCIITGGPGDYFSPFFLSNVKPANYVPGTTYVASANFQYIIPTPGNFLPGNLVNVQNSLFWGNELDSASFVSGSALYGYYAEDQTSNASLLIMEQDLSPTALGWLAYMINDSAATVTIQSQSNANYTLVDPTAYINMQNGILKWDYAMNTTTIQNSLNDISTRNLLYYGSLKYVSDPRLKQDIQPANLRRCYDIISEIPLHRYEFIDAYVSSFQVMDRRRLGIMADEYEQYFPKSVSIVDSPVPGLSTIKTVDTQQLDMAHLGATQYLLKEIAELRAAVDKIAALKAET